MSLSSGFSLMSMQREKQEKQEKQEKESNTDNKKNKEGAHLTSAGNNLSRTTSDKLNENTNNQPFNSDETPRWLQERLKQQAEKLASKKS